MKRKQRVDLGCEEDSTSEKYQKHFSKENIFQRNIFSRVKKEIMCYLEKNQRQITTILEDFFPPS